MRILQIIQKQQLRGAEIFCCQLSNHLLDLGHEVEVYSIFDGSSKLSFKNGVKSLKANKNNRHLDYKGWKSINDVIKKFKPHLVQANAADTLKYTVYSKKIFGWKQPIVYRNASIASFYINNYVIEAVNSFLLKNVTRIVSVSEFSQKDLVKLYKRTEKKIEVIPIGIEEFKIRNISIWNENDFNLVHVGSLTSEKNHQDLIDIFKLVLREKANVHLHIIGEGPLKNKIQEQIEKYDLKMHISLYGEVLDPYNYIAQANALLLPSAIEGLPAVLLEAMYCKTPVVAYDVGGIGEIVNNDTGYLIKKGDKNSFKKAILEVLANKPEHKIENAYKMVKEGYLNKKIALEFEAVYKDLLK